MYDIKKLSTYMVTLYILVVTTLEYDRRVDNMIFPDLPFFEDLKESYGSHLLFFMV